MVLYMIDKQLNICYIYFVCFFFLVLCGDRGGQQSVKERQVGYDLDSE